MKHTYYINLFYLLSKYKVRSNNFVAQSFKHEQLANLLISFKKDINKLMSYMNKLLYVKLFNMKVLLLRKLILTRHVNICVLNNNIKSNGVFIDLNSICKDYLFFFSLFDLNSTFYFSTFYLTYFNYSNLYDICAIYNTKLMYIYILNVLSFYFFFFYISFFSCNLLFFFSLSINFASLPNKLVKFTVLKSPHTDKKSREQFELKTYKKVLSYPYFFFDFYNYLFYHKHISFGCNITHKLSYYKHG